MSMPDGPAPASGASADPADEEVAAGSHAAEAATVPQASGARPGSAALLVAVGIFASRVIGLVRDRAIGYYFGVGAHADVYRLGLRAPNLLQNLLGEGTLSASFIPIYSRLLAEGRREDAGRFAGAVFGLLAAAASALALAGVLLAAPFVALISPGWLADAEAVAAGTMTLDRYALGVRVVQLAFPMTAVFVLSAWALGVLNSHRRFLLAYLAPVLWNAAILAALFGAVALETGGLRLPGGLAAGALADVQTRLLVAVFAGGVAGGVLQFGVQLPVVLRLLRGFRVSLSTRVVGVREGLRAFVPVVLGRGAYQLSGYLDTFLAGFLAAGALAALGAAQTLYVLPVSLFAMSVAASELPELSRISQGELEAFLARVRRSLAQILYLIVPTTVGYFAFGYLVVGTLYQTGAFGAEATWLVYLVLAGYTLGMAATTSGRLLQNAFYALGDTRTPARIAVWRVVVSGAAGAALMLLADRYSVGLLVGLPAAGTDGLRLGALGLALGSAVGAWVELWRLLAALRRHAPGFSVPWGRALRMAGLALAAAAPAAGVFWAMPDGLPVWLVGGAVLGVYGAGYLALGHVLGFAEGEAWTGRFLRRRART
ncbi:MAG: murein biosynthesis integral membrane protein MurJ [Rubricoccaceae bacterium]